MLLPGRIAPDSTGSRAWLQAGAYASVLPAPARGIPPPLVSGRRPGSDAPASQESLGAL